MRFLKKSRKRSGCACAFMGLAIALQGCMSVPPQVATTHAKERDIIESLRTAHLALVDAYSEEALKNFEIFFFNEYGPSYYDDLLESYEENSGRPYDHDRDFPSLYNDLVAEYQFWSSSIDSVRLVLRNAIDREFDNAFEAHSAVGNWLNSAQKLSDARRENFDRLLDVLKSPRAINQAEEAFEGVLGDIKGRLEKNSDNLQ